MKKRNALSLVELIIYLGVVSIVLLAMVDLVTHLVYSQTKTSNSIEVTQNSELIFSRLNQTIENASAISGSYPSNTLNLTIEGQSVVFSLNAGRLSVNENGQGEIYLNPEKIEITEINGPIFTKVVNGSSNSVQVNFEGRLKANQNIKEDFTSTYVMRGK
jgi:Tfp pilus assembly protein PilV